MLRIEGVLWPAYRAGGSGGAFSERRLLQPRRRGRRDPRARSVGESAVDGGYSGDTPWLRYAAGPGFRRARPSVGPWRENAPDRRR